MRSSFCRGTLLAFLATLAVGLVAPALRGQSAGSNVNMVSGTGWTNGDPFLQQQNEPSIPVSRRNTPHLIAVATDYRGVCLPGWLVSTERGGAWHRYGYSARQRHMPGSIHQVRRHAGHADNSCSNGIPDLQLVHGQHQLENHVYVLGGLWSDVGPSGQAQRKQLGQPGNYHCGGSEQRERRRGDDLCRVAAICDEFAARRDDDREVDGRG